MEKKTKIAQIYGYAVCLTAVITFLISITGFVNALIDMGDPLYAWGGSDANLASYENFKVNAMESIQKESAYIPDDNALHEMYEAAKTDKIKKVEHNSRKTIMVTSLMIILSIILFVIHWSWMGRLRKAEL